jgi:hypothetical protein
MKKLILPVLLIGTIVWGVISFINANNGYFYSKGDTVYYKQLPLISSTTSEQVTTRATDIRVIWKIVDDNAGIIITVLLVLAVILLLYGFIVILPSPIGKESTERKILNQ